MSTSNIGSISLTRAPEIRSGGMYEVRLRDQDGSPRYVGVLYVTRDYRNIAYSWPGSDSRAIDVASISVGIQLLSLLQRVPA
jgi:hypothetical protein